MEYRKGAGAGVHVLPAQDLWNGEIKTVSAKPLILSVLEHSQVWLACHEFHIGANGAAVSARLRELAREGKVVGRTRKGTSYKEWSLVRKAEQMEFSEAV